MTDDDDAILKKLGARERAQREAEGPGEPLGAEAEERIAGLLLGEPPRDEAREKPREEAREDAKVIRPRRWMWAAMPLAAAAAIVLYLSTRPSGELVPPYELALVTAAESRSQPAATGIDVVVDPEGEVTLVARPETRVARSGDLAVRAVVVRGGEASPWRAPVEISPEGAVRIQGPTKALFSQTSGACDLVLFVGHEATLPSPREALRLATANASGGDGYRVLRAHVRFAAAH